MKKIINNLTVAKILDAVAALLILVAIIVTSVSNSVRGYNISYFPFIIVLSIVSLLVIVLSIIFEEKIKYTYTIEAALLVCMVFSIICFALVINSRTDLIGTLWITALDSVNPLAVKAMNTGTAGFVLYLVSALLILISSFFSFKKVAD